MLAFTAEELDELRPYGAIGADCGPGWHALITPVLAAIRAHNRTCLTPDDHVALGPIREKFGTLRISLSCVHPMPPHIPLAVRVASSVAAHVCEVCGRVGVRARGPQGWGPVSCPTCAQHPTKTTAVQDALAASAPPLFDPDAPHWWQEPSPDHVLIFAAQSADPGVRAQALAHLGAWREGQATTWETVIAHYRDGAPATPYPDPLHTLASLLATGRDPRGQPATPGQLSRLLQHPATSVRVAAQMAVTPQTLDSTRTR